MFLITSKFLMQVHCFMFPNAFAFSSFFGKKNNPDSQSSSTPIDDKTRIRQLMADIVDAVNAQDMERFLALHTDSVVLIKDNWPNAVGKKAIEAFITPVFEAMRQAGHKAQLEVKIKNLQIVGDWAFGSGDFAFIEGCAKAGQQGEDCFNFIARRQPDGTWLRSHLSITGKLISEN